MATDTSFDFSLEDVQDSEILNVTHYRDLQATKRCLRQRLDADPDAWDVRERLAFLYAKERTSKVKRFDFDFTKADSLLREGLLRKLDANSMARLQTLVESYKIDLVMNPISEAGEIMQGAMVAAGISMTREISGYLRLKKRQLTCRQIQKKARFAIPRGQILTDRDGEYWYDEPIDELLRFEMEAGVSVSNGALLRLISLMQYAALKFSIRWIEAHRIETGGHNRMAVRRTDKGYQLRVGEKALAGSRGSLRDKLFGVVQAQTARIHQSEGQVRSEGSGVKNSFQDVELLILDFHGLSLGPHVVQDIMRDRGCSANIVSAEKALQLLEVDGKSFHVVGVSLSDRELQHFLKFIKQLRLSAPKTPVIIGGAATLQYRELFALLDDLTPIYIFLNDAEVALPELIRLVVAHHRDGHPVHSELSKMTGLVYRTGDMAALIRPEVRTVEKRYPLFLPKQEKRHVFDWNPNRGCPKRCAYCNNVQGRWRSSSLESMQSMVLAMVGMLCEPLDDEQTLALSIPCSGLEKQGGGYDSIQHPKNAMADLARAVEKRYKLPQCKILPYLAALCEPMSDVGPVLMEKAVLIVRALVSLMDPQKQLNRATPDRATVFTASDNFLGEPDKAAAFYQWLIDAGLPRYLNFRTQTSLDFLWNKKRGEPDREMISLMLKAGIESIGFGYDSSSNAIGTDALKRNTYNMMLKILDVMVQIGYQRDLIRIHHFYSTPISDFSATLEGLLLREVNISNDLGNKIAFVLYTHGSELGLLSKMDFESGGGLSSSERHVCSGVPEYVFAHSEASSLPMLDEKAELFLNKLFQFDPSTQEFEPVYDRRWLFAEVFSKEIRAIIQRWGGDENDPELKALGRLLKAVGKAKPGLPLMQVMMEIRAWCIRESTFSFERLLLENDLREGIEKIIGNITRLNTHEAVSDTGRGAVCF